MSIIPLCNQLRVLLVVGLTRGVAPVVPRSRMALHYLPRSIDWGRSALAHWTSSVAPRELAVVAPPITAAASPDSVQALLAVVPPMGRKRRRRRSALSVLT